MHRNCRSCMGSDNISNCFVIQPLHHNMEKNMGEMVERCQVHCSTGAAFYTVQNQKRVLSLEGNVNFYQYASAEESITVLFSGAFSKSWMDALRMVGGVIFIWALSYLESSMLWWILQYYSAGSKEQLWSWAEDQWQDALNIHYSWIPTLFFPS